MTEEEKIAEERKMAEEEKITTGELEREEREIFLEEGRNIGETKLDSKTLFYVGIGLIAVFFLMMVVNGYILRITSEQKTAFYLSILASNTLFIMLILIIKASKQLTWAELGWNTVKFLPSVKSVLKIWGLTWLIHMVYMMIIIYLGITPAENELVELLQKPTLLIFLSNVFLIAVAAPFIEETLFRGLLFGSLRTYFGCWSAIIISAAIFSALHFELVGFFPRFILGIGLGYLYVKYDSIYPSIGLHALNNLLAVVMISAIS